jgi:hypothetical protein
MLRDDLKTGTKQRSTDMMGSTLLNRRASKPMKDHPGDSRSAMRDLPSLWSQRRLRSTEKNRWTIGFFLHDSVKCGV